MMIVFTLLVQVGLGWSPTKAGVAGIPQALGMVVGFIVRQPLLPASGAPSCTPVRRSPWPALVGLALTIRQAGDASSHVGGVEGQLADDQLVEDDTERVEVGGRARVGVRDALVALGVVGTILGRRVAGVGLGADIAELPVILSEHLLLGRRVGSVGGKHRRTWQGW